jgi:hypothetical protein
MGTSIFWIYPFLSIGEHISKIAWNSFVKQQVAVWRFLKGVPSKPEMCQQVEIEKLHLQLSKAWGKFNTFQG